MNLSRQLDAKLYYSDSGILPRSMSLEIMPEFYRPLFNWFFWPEPSVVWIHAFYLIGLFSLALGFGGRVLNLFVWICHIGFMQRNFSIAFGADLIGNFYLLYLIFTQSCAEFSLRNLFGKSSPQKKMADLGTRSFYRMMQVQICIIYAYTGFEKLRGASWWDGTALWTVLANPQMVIGDLSFFREIPMFLVIATFFTIFFEIYWTPLVVSAKTRNLLLLVGLAFHAGIGFLMGLWGFALVMTATYILFVNEEQLRRMIKKLVTRLERRSPKPT